MRLKTFEKEGGSGIAVRNVTDVFTLCISGMYFQLMFQIIRSMVVLRRGENISYIMKSALNVLYIEKVVPRPMFKVLFNRKQRAGGIVITVY